jgi:putative two-component system response regulator
MTTDPNTAGRVLVVDDNETLTKVFERLLGQEGYEVEVAHEGVGALAAIKRKKPDLVLLDVFIPGMNGFEICRTLKNDQATRLLPVILVTGHLERENRIEGAKAGADEFLSKPVDTQELLARVRSLIRLKRYTDDLESASKVIMMLAVMVESRDGYTAGHCHRMANYAVALGRKLGLNDDQLQTLRRGGFLHDIGMLAIPDSVLRKPGALEPEEFELIKSHTVIGDSLCAHLSSLEPVREIVRHHHERLDGTGYPDGLRGDEVPLVAQIIGLVDVYDALTTQRAYQNVQPIEHAIATLREHVRLGWRSGDLVESFVSMIQSGTLESFKSDQGISWAPPQGSVGTK